MNGLANISLFAASALALAACNTATPPRTIATPPGQGLVQFEAGAFETAAPLRIGYVNSWQEEEYSKFDGKGASAEIIYSVADERDSIVLDFDLTLDRVIGTWHDAVSLGDKGMAEAPLGTFQYQRFTQTGAGRPCVGFLNEWDYRQGDHQLRPAKVLFGYYCGRAGSSLTDKQIDRLVSDLWIRDIDRIDVRFTPRTDLAARAGASPNAGNLRFPYARADRFVDADGERDG